MLIRTLIISTLLAGACATSPSTPMFVLSKSTRTEKLMTVEAGAAVTVPEPAATAARAFQLPNDLVEGEQEIDLVRIPDREEEIVQLSVTKDVSVVMTVKKLGTDARGIRWLRGQLAGKPPGEAYLTVDDLDDDDPNNDVVYGKIVTSDGSVFSITPLVGVRHLIQKIKIERRFDEPEPIPPSDGRSPPQPDPDPNIPNGILRILLVYSRDYAEPCRAKGAMLDQTTWQNEFTDIIRRAGSAVTVEFLTFCSNDDLVGNMTLGDQLTRVANSADVDARRQQVGADLVVSIVDISTGAGFAFYNYPLLATDQDRAFCVVRYHAAKWDYSMSHEIGHILGMQHEREVLMGGLANLCNYGFLIGSPPTKRTIMARGTTCPSACPRGPSAEFSTPPGAGIACGTVGEADNALQFRRAVWVASRFFTP